MPPPFSTSRSGFDRRSSRSISPSPNRQKRSWLQTADSGHPRHRSPLPPAYGNRPRKDFRPSSGYNQFPPRNRSRSPRHQKRPKWPPSGEGRRSQERIRPRRSSGEFRSSARPVARPRQRSRSLSPAPPPRKTHDSLRVQEHKSRKAASPDEKFSGPSAKKKMRQPSPGFRKRSRSRSPHLSFSVRNSRDRDGKHSSRLDKREEVVPPRKVSSSKKKAVKITLHKRFTIDDLPPFQLAIKDNVTIAVLRNPSAKPSEDVTVERVFDSTLFKMVHKKHEGRRPIFDREEIKVWRHDENLTDDPDFERRLIRVKKAPQEVGDSLTRMSPDVLRKAFGLDLARDRSWSGSPQREQQIRLNPRPDPRYEARYQQQAKKKEEGERRSGKPSKKKATTKEQRHHEERKKEGPQGHESHSGGKRQNKEDTYDLRQTLQKRRSDREDEDDSNVEGYSKRNQNYSDDDRNVIFNRKIARYDNDDKFDSRNDNRKDWWEGDARRGGFGRGGRKSRAGPRPRENWNPEGRGSEDRERDAPWDKRNTFRTFENRRGGRFGDSPPSNRGWRGRGGGFRGRGGREPDQFFDVEDLDRRSPPADNYYKFGEHDDRDISPRMARGRGVRGRPISRSFGARGFRGNRGFRSRGRGLNYINRGRGGGGFGENKFHRDDRLRGMSVEREWKHDMYDSLQREEEQPHSTSAN